MTRIDEQTTVRDLIQAHPEVFPVFREHGMCEECQQDPPPVPIAHFAKKHCNGNVVGLLHELHQAMQPVV